MSSLRPRRLAPLLVLLTGLGCVASDSASPEAPTGTLDVDPNAELATEVGQEVLFQARRVYEGGGVASVSSGTWSATDPSVARSLGGGRFGARGTGTTSVVVELDGLRATASLEVYLAPARDFHAGELYSGRRGYVEYRPGTLPIVVSAAHGGRLEPEEIPNRSYGVQSMDRNTAELAEAVRDALVERLGAAPHLVISRLRRTELDPNREVEEAAQGDPFAEHAWAEYHGFLDTARAMVTAEHGAGLYLDIHGHGHSVARVELGYLLSAQELELPDSVLATTGYVEDSSVRALVQSSGRTLPELVRGPGSLGGLLEARGVSAVPSPPDPDPGGEPYFSGGYSTVRHGSRDGGSISGIQLEHPFPGIRDSEENRRAYALALAAAVEAFLRTHAAGLLP